MERYTKPIFNLWYLKDLDDKQNRKRPLNNCNSIIPKQETLNKWL